MLGINLSFIAIMVGLIFYIVKVDNQKTLAITLCVLCVLGMVIFNIASLNDNASPNTSISESISKSGLTSTPELTPSPESTPSSISKPSSESTPKIVASLDFLIQGTKLVKYNGAESLINIPEGITFVDAEAFRDNNNVKYLIIPNTVTSLGDNSFRGCSNLEAVFMSDNINSIGYNVFTSTAQSLTIYGQPRTRQWVNEYAFISYDGGGLYQNDENFLIINGVLLKYHGNNSDVKIPNNTKIIANNVFNGRTDILNVSIPNTVILVDDDSFRGCEGLRYIIIPPSVITLGNNAFRDCSNLRAAFVTANITQLGYDCFAWVHDDFMSYGHPNAAQTMEDYPFEYCNMLDFSLNNEKWEIVKGVLLQYKGLDKKVIVPKGTEIISNNVFKDRTDIESVILPESVIVIDNNAFRNSGIVNITVPQGVHTLGNNAFRDCSNLEYAEIPNSVRNIGYDAFAWVHQDFTVMGNSGSIIQDYCSRNNINFILD